MKPDYLTRRPKMPGEKVAAWFGGVAVVAVLAAIAFAALAVAAMSFSWLAGQF